jgi:hypothetical protein
MPIHGDQLFQQHAPHESRGSGDGNGSTHKKFTYLRLVAYPVFAKWIPDIEKGVHDPVAGSRGKNSLSDVNGSQLGAAITPV